MVKIRVRLVSNMCVAYHISAIEPIEIYIRNFPKKGNLYILLNIIYFLIK